MNLDAIEARLLRVLRREPVLLHDRLHLISLERSRGLERNLLPVCRERPPGRLDRRRRNRQLVSRLVRAVRDAPNVPELAEDPSARVVDSVRHDLPSIHLLRGMNARSRRVALPLLRHLRRLRDDEPRRSTLRVVRRVQLRRHVPRLPAAHAGERRHDDAVGEFEVS